MTVVTETKRSRFSRIFPARVDKIRDQLRVLGNCSSKSSYEWDESQIERFFAYILQELETLAKSFGVEIKSQVNNQDITSFNDNTLRKSWGYL